MDNSELLKQILEQLENLNKTIENLKASVEANHELTSDKLGTLESIIDKIKQNTE